MKIPKERLMLYTNIISIEGIVENDFPVIPRADVILAMREEVTDVVIWLLNNLEEKDFYSDKPTTKVAEKYLSKYYAKPDSSIKDEG